MTKKPGLAQNPVKQKILKGETAFGIYITVPSPAIVEIAGCNGYDFVRIDLCHSNIDMSQVEHLVRAAELSGVSPMARVDNNPEVISRLLEMGIQGLVVPDIESVEAAKAAVEAARFSPIGARGIFGMPRVAQYGYLDPNEYIKWSNEEVLLGIQIESVEAVKHIDEILMIEGIDMCLSGRNDIAKSLGVPGQKNHPKVLELEEEIFNAAKKHGKSISVNLDPASVNFAENVAKWKSKGAQVITFGHDVSIIKKGFEDAITAALQV
jgi:4-hydroxy-2-oxoheptanedioate aldolase